MFARGTATVVLACAVVGASGAVAYARTGSVSNARSVVFYYGETAGSGKSQNFSGPGTARMCANSNGGSNNSFGASYYRQRFSMIPDSQIKFANVSYSEGLYESGNFTINADDNYYTKSNWSAVPSAPDGYNGYVATRYSASGSCS